MHGWRRTLAAAVLAGLAALVPCVAWYLAGSRSAAEQAARVAAEPLEEAHAEARRLAVVLGERLAALLASESRRAFTDYGIDPGLLGTECEEPFLPSPLAHGPADPLIWAHFQLDDVGQLTLPTLGPDALDGAGSFAEIQLAIREELECVRGQQLGAADREAEAASGEARNLDARGGPITVGPFSWHSSVVAGQPALVALREVATPAAVLTQGFLVRLAALDDLLGASTLPARVVPGETTRTGQAPLPLDGDPWHVEVDTAGRLEEARERAARILAGFRRSFALGAAGALLAAALTVLIVAQTERLARLRTRFAAAAAHELRTPLAGLQLYGEMLADGSGDPSRAADYGRRVAGEAARLARVVTNVLGLSRLERGGLTLAPAVGDLAATVRESLTRLEPSLAADDLELCSAFEEPLPPVRFDRDAVHQILQNLLDNAEKYTRDAPDRTVRVELAAEGDEVRLSVVDRGPGVPGALRRRLFRPFVRDPNPEAPDGLGIGLSLVAGLARAQSARVVHDAPGGRGSRFSVYFPAA